MTAIRFATSIVLGLVATTSAFAAEPEATTTVATAATVATATATAAPVGPSPKTRYCIKSEVTGSRIDRALCDTRRNWQAQGVDIDAMIATRRR